MQTSKADPSTSHAERYKIDFFFPGPSPTDGFTTAPLMFSTKLID